MKWLINKTFLTPSVEQFPGRQISSWTSKTINTAWPNWQAGCFELLDQDNSSDHDEITKMQNEEVISKKSKILQFNPFLDDKGILCVGGRLAFSNLFFEEKHTILLPKKHFFLAMLIIHFHQENIHAGVDQTHFFLRERYWIAQLRQIIRSLLHRCIKCSRITSHVMDPIMGNMPKGSTQLSQTEPSWTHVGVDLTGAIQLGKVGKRTVTPEHAYSVLYNCMTTQSVYLDLMLTNKTVDFLL